MDSIFTLLYEGARQSPRGTRPLASGCGPCRNCLAGRRHLCKDTVGIGVNRPGAFAETISVPVTNVWHHTKGVDEEVALAPVIAGASLGVLKLLSASAERRDQLIENTRFFREAMTREGFNLLAGEHPIVPVMIAEAAEAARFADAMLDHGVYVIAFSYPVVPQGKARIRTQISAAHTREELERAVAAFVAVRSALR